MRASAPEAPPVMLSRISAGNCPPQTSVASNRKWPIRPTSLPSGLRHSATSFAAIANPGRPAAAKAFRELEASERLQRQTRPESQSGVNFGEASEDAVGNLLLWIHKLPELAKAAFDAG